MATYRILLVDDDPDVRASIREVLEQKFEIIEARDGEDAIAKLHDVQPDFAIVDGVMPRLNGFELCTKIRAQKEYEAIPIIFLSGYGSQKNIKQAYDSGANLFLSKPTDPLRILKNIKFTIEHETPTLRRKKYRAHDLDRMGHEGHWDNKEIPPAAEAVKPEPQRQPDPEPVIAAEPEPKVEIRDIPQVEVEIKEPTQVETPKEEQPTERIARILVVEKNDELRETIFNCLHPPYEVITSRDGLDAVERTMKYQPDLVMIDTLLPRMNGYQFLKFMREKSKHAKLPIILLSHKTSERDRHYGFKLGATDIVAKPFTPNEVLCCVEDLFAQPTFEIREKTIPMIEIIEHEFLDSAGQNDIEGRADRQRKHSNLSEILKHDTF